ncbi:AsmA family protein [Deminuibacter soli]|nr:AsmA-like C-terminal region-containing protein [Deminuibacter soli]
MRDWLHHKIVRVTAIALLALMGLYALLLLGLQLYISGNKEKLLAELNQKLTTGLKGDVHLQNVRVNVWAHFPQVEITLENFTITDTLHHVPLVSIEKIFTRVALTDVLGKRINVRAVTLSNGFVHIATDSTGYSNKYALMPVKSNNAGNRKKEVFVKEVELNNITAISEDAVKQKHFEILFQHATASLHKRDTVIDIRLRERAILKGLGFNLAKGQYLLNKSIEGRWDLHVNTATKTISFPASKIDIDKHPFELQGSFTLDTAQSHFNLLVKTKQVGYRQAGELLTANIQRALFRVNLLQPVDVTAHIEGSMASGTTPLVKVDWATTNNTLVTPAIAFNTCSFTGTFFNEDTLGQPRTDGNSIITLHTFTGDWGGILLKGNNTIVRNLEHPNLVFDFASSCSFPALDDKFGLRTLRFVKGNARLQLQYNGPLVADASAMENLSGKLVLQNGEVHYEPRNLTFSNCNGEITFSDNDVEVKKLQCNIGSSKFTVAIQGNDIGRMASSDPGKSSLLCYVYSDSLNLKDFKSLFGKPQGGIERKKSKQNLARAAFRFDQLLERGTFLLNIKAAYIRLNQFTATNLDGTMSFKHNFWQMQNATVQHAGGNVSLKGNVRQTGNAEHVLDINTRLQNVDVRKLFYAFENFGLSGLSYQNLQGTMDMTANVSLGVNYKSALIPNSVNGNIFFSLKDGALINFEPIRRIQQYVFKDRDLRNIHFAELTDSLLIKEDEITIKRMEVQSTALTLFVEGLYSMKGNTDISIQVPLSNFVEQKDLHEKPKNQGVDRKVGPSVYLRAKTDLKGNIKIGLDLFKKLRRKDRDKNKT